MKLITTIFIACLLALSAANAAGILKPGQGEPVFTGGESYPLAWEGAPEPVRFELTTDGGASWSPLPLNLNAKTWQAPKITTRNAAIRMLSSETNEELARTGDLRILAGKLKFLAPAWGETLRAGSEFVARWDCVSAEPFELSISLDGGYAWEPLAAVGEPMRGYARVRLPEAFTYEARLRASLPGQPDMEYDRTGDFSIEPLSSALDSAAAKEIQIGNAAPSPATDYVSFGVYTEKSDEKIVASVINERGDQLIAKTFNIGKGIETISIDVRALAPGAYFVNFEFEGKLELRKFLKE